MQYSKLALLAICFFYGCASQKRQPQKEAWTDTYKNIVAISAIKQAKPQVDSNDVSPAINFDLIGHDDFAKEADSLGKAFYRSILPPTIYKKEGLKAVLNQTLLYYKSKELDRLAKSAYKRYKEVQKRNQEDN